MNHKSKQSISIYESIKEIAEKNKHNEETKKFNHFIETGETIPEKQEGQYLIEALADITRLSRPGPLSGGEKLVNNSLLENALVEIIDNLNPSISKQVLILNEPFCSTEDKLKKP